ncbi:oligosaccharide flippase family protein [Vibrio splendidus]
MTGYIRLFKNSMIYIIASTVNAAIPFLLLPILTRYLTPEEYGVLAVFNTVVSLFFILCSVNVHASANRYYFECSGDDRLNKLPSYLFNSFIIVFFSTGLVVFSCLIFKEYIVDFLNVSFEVVMLALTLAVFNIFTQMRLGQWQVREKPIPFGLLLVCQSMLNMLFSLMFVVVWSFGVEGRIGAILLANIIFSMFSLYLLYKDKLVKWNFSFVQIKSSLVYGAPLVPHMLGAFLLLMIDRALINSYLGSKAAGIYMVAFQVSLVLSLLFDSINKAVSPWFFKKLNENTHSAKIEVVKVVYFLLFIFFIITAVSFLSSKYFIDFVIGEEFSSSADIAPLLLLAQGFRGGYLLVSNFIFYKKNTYVISIITVFTGIFNVTLLIYFIDSYGLIGAAYSLPISMALQWLFTWAAAQRAVEMPWLFWVRVHNQ